MTLLLKKKKRYEFGCCASRQSEDPDYHPCSALWASLNWCVCARWVRVFLKADPVPLIIVSNEVTKWYIKRKKPTKPKYFL